MLRVERRRLEPEPKRKSSFEVRESFGGVAVGRSPAPRAAGSSLASAPEAGNHIASDTGWTLTTPHSDETVPKLQLW